MADDTDPGQQPIPVTPPPNMYASQTILSLSPTEFIIGLGHSRLFVTNDGNAIMPNQITEWLISVSMSPSTAKMLSIALENGVKTYEENFGNIPITPGFTAYFPKTS